MAKMETIKIPFSGINRSIDDGISNDGQCMELINARIKNGSIEPIGNPILLSKLPIETDRIYYHTAAQHYITVTNDGLVYSLNEDYTINEQLSSDLNGLVENIEFIGNTACVITKKGLRYILFSKGKYNYLGEKPKLKFNVWAKNEKKIAIVDKSYNCQFTNAVTGDLTIDSRDVNPFLDFIDACKNEALAPYQNEARIAEPLCVRAALRMYDGTYICHTPIQLMCPISNLRKSFETINGSYISPGSEQKYGRININSLSLYSYILKYDYTIIGMDMWKDLILSLDIFISRPFSIIDTEKCLSTGISISNTSKQIRLQTYGRAAMLDKIMSASSKLYLSKSAIADSDEGIIDTIGDTSSQQLIGDDTHSSLYSQTSYVYNSRLHLGNIHNILYEGFSPDSFRNSYENSYNGCSLNKKLAACKIYTYISTDEGEKIVYTEGGVLHPLNSVFCYPDNRAYKTVIYATLVSESNGLIHRRYSMDLKKANNMNMAFYLGFDVGINRGIWPIDLSLGTAISESDFNTPGVIINNIEISPCKIKVSSLNNPFYFPVSQTYQPSSEEVIGMCSNASELSQGQFGQHPLYVFAKDGVYAMSIGSGGVVYANQVLVSRDICINRQSIKGIDRAVVFASTKGLMLVNGANVTFLSQDMEGYLPSCISSSPIISKIASISSMNNSIEEVVFREYLSRAKISYNYQENDIVIANSAYHYSYLYSVVSKSWCKISSKIESFVYDSTRCVAIIDSGIYNMQNNHRSVSKILLLTKPIKMGSNSHKRIIQAVIRGIVKRALSDLYLRGEAIMLRKDTLNIFSDVGMYILGSNDAEHFTLISGKENIVDMRDLVTKMNKSKSYKYFMVALAGGVRTDVSLNYMEFTTSESFTNRLR